MGRLCIMIGMYDEPVAVPIIDLLDSSMMS
nr:MAG TPA: hypothetical protein [Caudoviricetes sp.]DAG25830.1 MAG TPA: hypothetical protein [Bacteriophage sp.]DAH14079.1 MAG TPA: hypothetical protein [Caudoviricetes sp.]